MKVDCFPISMLPRQSRLFLDYASSHEPLSPFFVSTPWSQSWANAIPAQDPAHSTTLADRLLEQNQGWHAGPQAIANIERLRQGAGAVVSGQQVALFGGPLFTFLKAATIIQRAQAANAVPIFWLATEDHDLAEADHVTLPSRHALHTLRLHLEQPPDSRPVGALPLGPGITAVLDRAAELIGGTPEFDLLATAYAPDATFASSFARLIAATFADYGLVVIDASTRAFHALGAPVLRQAIEHAANFESALHNRDKLLAERDYHSQVLVAPGSSLLFLLDETTGARIPLRRKNGSWLAGKASFSTADLLAILDAAPERLSPNALLRPVFQDFLLPTLAAIGGPAEIAYFAQSQVLYQAILAAPRLCCHASAPRSSSPPSPKSWSSTSSRSPTFSPRTLTSWPIASARAPSPSKASAVSLPPATSSTTNSTPSSPGPTPSIPRSVVPPASPRQKCAIR